LLVFISDIHLTDGTSGATINAGAFDLFVDQVADLARKRRASEVRLVILGDGLDIIRSSRWLDAPGDARPWRPAGPGQEAVVLDILQAIIERNAAALNHLRQLSRRVAARRGVPAARVRVDYVLGNHDWLINRYRSGRRLVVRAMGLPEEYVDRGFPLEFVSPPEEYDVLARHGDVYDRWNYNAACGRDASSIGDVILIKLQRRFPEEVGRLLGDHPRARQIVERLREIDNVRPYSRIGAWVTDAIADLGQSDPACAATARKALGRCIDDFVRNDEYHRFRDRQLTFFQRMYLRLALSQIRTRQFHVLDRLTRIGERLLKIWRLARGEPVSESTGHALQERLPDGRRPRYVVYGHTHRVEVAPLGLIEGTDEHRYYLNVGTWQSVWQRAETAGGHTDFASWKEMSYAAVYRPGEAHGKHEFEMWTGSLRDREAVTAEMPSEQPTLPGESPRRSRRPAAGRPPRPEKPPASPRTPSPNRV
jgi:UDP-2,3-diacylglucosamine pyrophosphatase LpxH